MFEELSIIINKIDEKYYGDIYEISNIYVYLKDNKDNELYEKLIKLVEIFETKVYNYDVHNILIKWLCINDYHKLSIFKFIENHFVTLKMLIKEEHKMEYEFIYKIYLRLIVFPLSKIEKSKHVIHEELFQNLKKQIKIIMDNASLFVNKIDILYNYSDESLLLNTLININNALDIAYEIVQTN